MRTVLYNLTLLFGCSELPNQRRSAEVVLFDQTNSLTVLRWSQGDSGWLKGQGHFRATWWSPTQSPLQFWDHAPKEYVQWNDSLKDVAMRHQLERLEEQWVANSHFDEWNLRIQTPCDNKDVWSNTSKDWSTTVSCMSSNSVGWLQSYKRSHPIQGWSFIIEHTGHKTIHKHLQVFGFSHTQYLYAEVADGLTGGTFVDRQSTDITEITNIQSDSDQLNLHTSTGQITIPYGKLIGIDDPYEHLASWERWTNHLFPSNQIEWSLTNVVIDDSPMTILIRQQGQ